MCYLFLAALFHSFFVSSCHQFDYDIFGHEFWDLILFSWICKFMFFTQTWELSVIFIKHILLHCIFSPLLLTPVANTRSFGFVPLISEVLFILFPMLCFFLCSDGIIFVVNLQIHWLFPVSSPFCDWIHSVAFFILPYCIFKLLLMYTWLCWVLVVTQEIFAVSCGIFHCGTWTVPCSLLILACW